MPEILLARHAQSHANKRNFTAFGNEDSPLTDRGVDQCEAMAQEFCDNYGIVPEQYSEPVLTSTYRRTHETATTVGFQNIHVNPIIKESDVDTEILSGTDVIKKHAAERWAPLQTRERAMQFIDRVGSGDFPYRIYFTHGLFIASVLLEFELMRGSRPLGIPFTSERGYIPLQASITPLKIEL